VADLETPWGVVRVEDAIPEGLACDRCGTCCRGFILSVTPPEIERWYERFLAGNGAEHPPDVGAVRNLFVPYEGIVLPDGQLYTCRAFDAESNRCTLLPDAPELRPIACWAFPYVYDVASLGQFPYPGCGIFRRAVRALNARAWRRVWEAVSPFADRERG
jgi:Fe-S-cluster containining protein